MKSSRRPISPWQNPFAERLIGSIRRECLNHVLVHLALDKDAPDVRLVERPEAGRIVQISEVGGLHRRYVRRAA